MNKAETGESSLDDTVAVPAKEVAWGLPSPTSCTTSIEMPPASSAPLTSLHLTSETLEKQFTVEKRTVYLVYQHQPQPAEADVG